MSQEQLNTIVKILNNGAPALSNELANAIVNILKENAQLKKELNEMKAAKTSEADKAENEKETN